MCSSAWFIQATSTHFAHAHSAPLASIPQCEHLLGKQHLPCEICATYMCQYVPRRQVHHLHRWMGRKTASPVPHPFCRGEFLSVNIPASGELRITGGHRNKNWHLEYKNAGTATGALPKTHTHTASLWAGSLLLSHVYVHMFIYVYVYADMCAYISFSFWATSLPCKPGIAKNLLQVVNKTNNGMRSRNNREMRNRHAVRKKGRERKP